MSDIMHELALLAEQQAAAEVEVAEAEAALKARKEELRIISEETIPEKMEAVGLTTLKTETGLTIKIDDTIRANISKDNTARAMAWLREHGHQFLIKRTLTVIASDDEQGDELASLLDGYDVADMPKVNAQSLSKFVREMLAEGEDVPQDLFGVYRQRKAKVVK